MDSKLKRVVILLATFLCITVLLVVVAGNYDRLNKLVPKSSQSTVDTVENAKEDAVKDSRQIGNDLSAWKRDDSFFDNEASTLAARLKEEMMTLSFKAVSVEKDLRVRVFDYQDKLLQGENIEVLVKSGNGAELIAEDTDKDGVLYLDCLDSGEYSISLQPIKGYIVPDYPLMVKVYDRVQYSSIEDIELLVVEESESEAAIDDLMILSADAYADKKQNTKIGSDEALKYGVDLSCKNSEADFNAMYKAGLDFVMLRAGYRGAITGDLVVDKTFESNAHSALRAGLDVGVYFDSQAVTEVEAVEEASLVVKKLEKLHITYPVAIRLDSAGGLGRADSLDETSRTAIAEAFLKTVKNAGYDTMVYASSNWLETNVEIDTLEKYGLWMAEYKKNIGTKNYWYDMWQYTSQGSVPGIDGKVSLSISYIED